MKKLLLGLAVASAVSLTGCDDETINDVQNDTGNVDTLLPNSRVVFDPKAERLSIPNDLVFSDTQDGTLNFGVDDPTDFANPRVALNALDGWSTSQPFVLQFDFAEGVSLDPASLLESGAVVMFEAVMGASLTDADCASVPAAIGCKAVAPLIFGQDYVVQARGNDLVVIPMRPLKAKTTYILALTKALKDSEGMPILGSEVYELVRQDVNTLPLADPEQLLLQNIINSYENLAQEIGVNADDITYTMAMTTQSIDNTLQVTKQLLAASLTEQALFAKPMVQVQDSGLSVAQVLASQGAIDPMNQQLMGLYGSANYMVGSVTIPNYLGVPSAENPVAPTNVPWKAMCDSGVMLAFATNLPAEPQSQSDAICMSFGLRDLGIDAERNLTKFNPIPAMTKMQTVDVQMTTPDLAVANAVRAQLGMPEMTMPENGWPVVMLQHGVTSRKEDMLAITGMLSINGFATAAIDHPLHNSRGYDLDMDGNNDIDAVTNPFAYINIASLLNTRDNLRQSTADLMAFRLGLNFTQGAMIDSAQVHFLGHSLGAITGVNFLALTNDENEKLGAANAFFKVHAGSLAMPGAGIANFMMESPSFSALIKPNLAYSSSEAFKAFADAQLGELAADPMQLVAIWPQFVAMLDEVQLAELNSVFSLYTFAAQTITGAGDPLNYVTTLRGNGTPLHLIEVVGDGMNNLSDQVVPNTVSTHPLSGSSPLITLLGTPVVSETVMSSDGMPISGAVKYVKGHHGSVLDPSTRPEAPDAEMTSRATQEMQAQIATYFATGATVIPVNDAEVVLQ
ncbi:VolA/Pla-1 family phospholipase [Thalassotalea aquiviva]|uniref:VolA/Pla-1 family phospholipase n=1 Tax=Thalassotalea aquiviva TaxID=3242415 RepID=UPI00352B7301